MGRLNPSPCSAPTLSSRSNNGRMDCTFNSQSRARESMRAYSFRILLN
jgi:hypothetical protein